MGIKISICMPCYNSEKYLHYSIGSILNQTYENWELLCVDDGSTDNTYEILEQYAKQDSRIKIYKKENGGCATYACQFALNHIKGEFYAAIGHDDEISPNCLEYCVYKYNLAIESDKIDAIIPDALIYFSNNEKKNYKISPKNKNAILTGKEAFVLSLDWSISGFALFRTEIVKKCGYYTDGGMNGDEYSVREFYMNCNKVIFASRDDVYYKYIQVPVSLTKKMTPRLFDIYKTHMKLEELAKKHKLPSKIIKKINRERYSIYKNLLIKYLKNKNSFTAKEQDTIEALLADNLSLLKPYKNFCNYFYYRLCDEKGKFIVLFSCFKIYYGKFNG